MENALGMLSVNEHASLWFQASEFNELPLSEHHRVVVTILDVAALGARHYL
jgi:hypothetical protein